MINNTSNYQNMPVYIYRDGYLQVKPANTPQSSMPGNISPNPSKDVFIPAADVAETTAALKQDLAKTKSEQGIIGKAWDGFKNLTRIGDGSNKAEKAIEDLLIDLDFLYNKRGQRLTETQF